MIFDVREGVKLGVGVGAPDGVGEAPAIQDASSGRLHPEAKTTEDDADEVHIDDCGHCVY